jgi:hypothetical protein
MTRISRFAVQKNFLRTFSFLTVVALFVVLVGCGTNSNVTVINPPAGSAPSSTITVGHEPMDVVACDLNGDSKTDLVVVNSADNSLTILLGKGDGTFTASTLTSSGVSPVQAACADFNGDGKADLAVVNENSQSVSILIGNGDGTFNPGTSVFTGVGTQPSFIASADFNNDGHADLIVTYKGGSTMAEILIGMGDGTFAYTTSDPVVGNPVNVAIGNFTGKVGETDIAFADSLGKLNVSLGDGNGGFGTVVNTGISVGPYLAAADMNGDGKLDLVSSVGAVLLGNGDGTFTQAASGFAGDSFVAVGNFGSKQLGIAMIATNEAIVNVYSGNGDGTINQSGKTCSVGQNPRAIAVADFNGDGKADIAVASSFSNSVSIVLGQ